MDAKYFKTNREAWRTYLRMTNIYLSVEWVKKSGLIDPIIDPIINFDLIFSFLIKIDSLSVKMIKMVLIFRKHIYCFNFFFHLNNLQENYEVKLFFVTIK